MVTLTTLHASTTRAEHCWPVCDQSQHCYEVKTLAFLTTSPCVNSLRSELRQCRPACLYYVASTSYITHSLPHIINIASSCFKSDHWAFLGLIRPEAKRAISVVCFRYMSAYNAASPSSNLDRRRALALGASCMFRNSVCSNSSGRQQLQRRRLLQTCTQPKKRGLF